MELFMKDRPTEFFDLFTRKEGSITRSYGCHVNYDNNGDAELNTTLLIYEDESEEPTKIEQIATKAIVHIDENLHNHVNDGDHNKYDDTNRNRSRNSDRDGNS